MGAIYTMKIHYSLIDCFKCLLYNTTITIQSIKCVSLYIVEVISKPTTYENIILYAMIQSSKLNNICILGISSKISNIKLY